MTRHTKTILTLFVAGGLSMILFTVKQQMQDMEDEITSLNSSLYNNEQAIHVLKAEWSHLNDPKRLRDLAARHLGLGPIKPEQMGSVADLDVKVDSGESTNPMEDFFVFISSALLDEGSKP